MDGEDSPRRVLCPWRVHPLASTFPAVARATAGRLVRCEWLVGRVVGALRGSASGFSVRCSPVRDSLESRGPADSRAQWLRPLTTDGQPCGEQLTQKPLAGLFGTRTTRPTSHSHLTKRPAVARATAGARCWQEGAPWVRPPGTEHPPRAILAVHEVDHLNHLVSRSGHLAQLLLQLAQRVPPASFSIGLALSSVHSLRQQGTQA